MKRLIAFFLCLAVLGGVLYFVSISFSPLSNLVISILGKRLNADLECSSMRIKMLRSLEVDNVTAVGADGTTITIKKGVFLYNPVSIITGRLEINCSLEDVSVSGKASLLDLVMDLLSMEYLEDIKFGRVSGHFFIGLSDTITKNLSGISEYIKFYADGVTGKDNSVNLRIRLLLNDEITSSIPKEMRGFLLKKESGPWMSISIGVTGNYKKPSLRLLSSVFELNILNSGN